MALWQSIPFACVLIPLFGAAVCSVLPRRFARGWATGLVALVTGLSCWFLAEMNRFDGAYAYRMGHYGAPWGNELRAGPEEAVMGMMFAGLTLICLIGGARRLEKDITAGRQGLYHTLILLMLSALMAQVYTNDLFTAYVFVEIMTIAGCGLIAARAQKGQALVAAVRYMVMNLIGSALFLLGIILLYGLTGHLLMPNLREAVAQLRASGQYDLQLTVVVALLCTGLAAKGALFPFHTWVPDAYSNGTPTSSALLASLVSKSYIVLLVKVMLRVIGVEAILASDVHDVMFGFGIVGMLAGSVVAIRSSDVRRMIAWSSVAQIGYIFMGIGLGTEAGMTAALFHIIAHAAAKSILFLAVEPLSDASGGHGSLEHLRGAGYRAPLAGAAFTVGALSLTGLPLLGGFVSKLNLGLAALDCGGAHAWIALAALALSTLLNVLYMVRIVLVIWSHSDTMQNHACAVTGNRLDFTLVLLIASNIGLFFFASPIMEKLRAGIGLFG